MLSFIFKKLLPIIFLSFFYPVFSYAGNSHLNKSIETNNFKIIYNENSTEIAHVLASNIENWSDEVYTFLGNRPRFKITVFINNDVDLPNSFSLDTIISLFLNNNYYAYPLFNNYELEFVFKHELAHNVTRLGERDFLLGRVLNPFIDAFHPTWFHEGNSVLVETKVTNGGRIVNPYFWSPERFLVDNKLNNYFYYRDADPYLTGASFFNFYYNNYGKEKTRLAYSSYINRPIYKFFYDPIVYFSDVASKSYGDLLLEWQNYLVEKYSKESKRNYIQGEEIKLGNYYISELLGESSNGELVIYGNKKNILSDEKESYFIKMNDEGKIVKKRRADNSLSSVSYDKTDDSFTFTKYTINNIVGSLYNKGYSTHMNMFSSTKKINDSLRAFKIVKGKNNCYYYLVVDNEKTALLDCDNKELIPFSQNQIMEHLRYDEEKNILYLVAGKLEETIKYIYIYDLNNNKLNKIVEGLNPYITGNKLYFSYAKFPDGISNIYEYDLSTKELKQITDTKYGAFSPIVINNSLYYMSYSTDKDDFIKESIFYLEMPIQSQTVDMYSNNEINKPFDSGYNKKSQYNNAEFSYDIVEKSNNYAPIYLPSFFYNPEGITIDFLLGTGRHELALGLAEGGAFISFFQRNLSSTLIVLEDPFYNIGFYDKIEGSKNVGKLDFNPVLLNGYGYLPGVMLNTSVNTLGGGVVGFSLLKDYYTLTYKFNKPKTKDSKKYGYNEINASYNVFRAKMIKVEGNGEIDFSMDPLNKSVEKKLWNEDINKLYMATIDIPFSFYVYKGIKTGYIGYNKLVISPKASYIHSSDASNNYTNNEIVALTFSNHIQVLYQNELKLNLTVYASYKDNKFGKTKDQGVYFSLAT